MASVFPFRAWHPHPENIEKVSCPPYDVINTEEARALAENNPKSFLHVIRPEIDLPAGTPFNDEDVYKKGAENLRRFLRDGLLIQEQESNLYLYQLEWEGKTQTGIFCCVSVEEYDREVILKHELTRPHKEDDRTKHILAQQAHAEPVMLTYKEQPAVTKLQQDVIKNEKPLFSFKAADDVQHRLWKIIDAEPFIKKFKEVSRLYIADGHHRCKSASRAAHVLRKGNGELVEAFNYFPAVIFPASQMKVLAYNRLVHHLPEKFREKLYDRFDIIEDASPLPGAKGYISLFLDGEWLGLELRGIENARAVEKLDVYRLQKFILEPLLNIKDQRRDDNISFVGGIRGTHELEKKVMSGGAELAISLYPTAIEELIAVSDKGDLMPPKSTWFEPKLRSGLLVHTF